MNNVKTQQSYTEINIGYIDRIIRGTISVILILFVLVSPYYPALGVNAYIALLAIYPAFTAVCGWEPIYDLLDISRSPVNVIDIFDLAENDLAYGEKNSTAA